MKTYNQPGVFTLDFGRYRVQLYYPAVRIIGYRWSRLWSIDLDTVITYRRNRGTYWGAGVRVLGFGIAVDCDASNARVSI